MTQLAVVMTVALAAAGSKPAPGGTLRVGVVAVEGTKTAQADADRLAKYLGAQLGRPAQARVYSDYLQFANDFQVSKVDVAWLPPVLTVRAILADAKLVAKVVRNGGATYKSVIFTRADAPWADPKDLKKVRAAWVSKGSAAGYVFPMALLSHNKLQAKKMFRQQRFLGGHDAVCKAVLAGEADIGATFADAEGPPAVTGCRQSLGAEADKLKVLAVTGAIPSDVIALRPDVDEPTRTAVHQAMLGLPGSAEGKALLSEVFHAEKLVDATAADYEAVAQALEVTDRLK